MRLCMLCICFYCQANDQLTPGDKTQKMTDNTQDLGEPVAKKPHGTFYISSDARLNGKIPIPLFSTCTQIFSLPLNFFLYQNKSSILLVLPK